MLMPRSLLVVAAISALPLLGCENPADNKPVATVGSAKPTTPPTSMASATPTAASSAAASATATAAPAPSLASIPAKPAEAFDIDKESKFEFVGSKVTGKHEGKFESFSGWAELNKGKAEGGKIAVEMTMSAIKSDDEKLDGHLKSKDFFDVATYPKATFESTEIKKGGEKGATHTITGNLDFHGVKKSITFPATIKESAKEVEAKAEFVINRKDFNIVYAGKADDLIRDEVVLKMTIKVPVKK